MGERPKYRVVAKSKTSGNFQDILAIWENNDRPGLFSGQLDRDVESIKLKSGHVITNADVYWNLQIRKDEQNQDSGQNFAESQATTEEDTPF
jgi:hypothetical protein